MRGCRSLIHDSGRLLLEGNRPVLPACRASSFRLLIAVQAAERESDCPSSRGRPHEAMATRLAVRSAPRVRSLSPEAQGRSFRHIFNCLIIRHHPRLAATRIHPMIMTGQRAHLHARHSKVSEGMVRPTTPQERKLWHCCAQCRWQWTGRASEPTVGPTCPKHEPNRITLTKSLRPSCTNNIES